MIYKSYFSFFGLVYTRYGYVMSRFRISSKNGLRWYINHIFSFFGLVYTRYGQVMSRFRISLKNGFRWYINHIFSFFGLVYIKYDQVMSRFRISSKNGLRWYINHIFPPPSSKVSYYRHIPFSEIKNAKMSSRGDVTTPQHHQTHIWHRTLHLNKPQ